MADALSQKDIDALLKTGASAIEQESLRTVDAVPYNFRRPPLIHRDRQATLEAVNGRFALSLQALLSSRLRTPCDVVINSVEQATFAEFTFSLTNPCAAFVFQLAGAHSGWGVIDLGTDLAFFLVDRLFGGPGESTELKRATTPLERLLVKGITKKMLELLAEVWTGHLTIQSDDILFESTPEAMQAVNREDNVLVTNLEVRAGSFSGWVSLCLPLLALEGFLQEKSTRADHTIESPEECQMNRVVVEASICAATMPLVVRFPSFTLRTRELAALAEGAVIQTNHPLGEPVEVLVSGQKRFLGMVGQVRRHIGLHITHRFQDATGATSTPLRGQVL